MTALSHARVKFYSHFSELHLFEFYFISEYHIYLYGGYRISLIMKLQVIANCYIISLNGTGAVRLSWKPLIPTINRLVYHTYSNIIRYIGFSSFCILILITLRFAYKLYLMIHFVYLSHFNFFETYCLKI